MDRSALSALLIRHEGLVLKPYVDTVGKLTIGCGRNLTDNGISDAEAQMLLSNDVGDVLRDLASFPWWAGLSETRQQAMADMRFNLGPTGFRQFRHMIHALAVGDYLNAAREMRASAWAKQVGARAEELAVMMEQGS